MSYKAWKDEPFDWAPTPKLGSHGWIAHKDAPAAPPPAEYTNEMFNVKVQVGPSIEELFREREANLPRRRDAELSYGPSVFAGFGRFVVWAVAAVWGWLLMLSNVLSIGDLFKFVLALF